MLVKLRTLKKTPKILFALALIFICSVGFANTNGNEKKADTQEQDQEGRRKSNQGLIRPDGDASQQRDVRFQEESKSSQPEVKEVNNKIEKADSVQDDSVSKYNFIFYFLYKFKYEEEAP